MDTYAAIALGLAMAFNFGTIYWKLKTGNIANAVLDGLILALIMMLSAGSVAGLSIGTIASAAFSIYLFFDPVDQKRLGEFGFYLFDVSMGLILGDSKKRKKKRQKKKQKMLKKEAKKKAKTTVKTADKFSRKMQPC